MIAYRVNDNYDDRPLFGTSTRRERLLNLVVGVLTTILVAFTLVSAFIFPESSNLNPLNIFFAFCISFVCISLVLLIHWYRQGDVDPKFRQMIYYNSFTIICLCVCANLYFHDIAVTCTVNNSTITP